jgi:hypothetical protein
MRPRKKPSPDLDPSIKSEESSEDETLLDEYMLKAKQVFSFTSSKIKKAG